MRLKLMYMTFETWDICQLLKFHIVLLWYTSLWNRKFSAIFFITGNIVSISFVNHTPHMSLQVAEFVNAGISLISTLWRITFICILFFVNYSLPSDWFSNLLINSKLDNLPGFTKGHAGLFGCTCSIHSECKAFCALS